MGYDFIFGWASKKICLCRLAQKRTQLEPVPHNHFGPIDASKGNSSHGGQARIAENNMCSFHVTARNKSASHRRSKTPQEPAQHNHVGPTDAFKGRCRHGQLECIGANNPIKILDQVVIRRLHGSKKQIFFFPWRAKSGHFLRPLRRDSRSACLAI